MQKLAFVFPGQGSQSVGMMAAYGDDAEIRAAFDEASLALGEDLWAMAADGPAERLSLTTNTQPLMLTAGVAVPSPRRRSSALKIERPFDLVGKL